jgi:hypothetical protein
MKQWMKAIPEKRGCPGSGVSAAGSFHDSSSQQRVLRTESRVAEFDVCRSSLGASRRDTNGGFVRRDGLSARDAGNGKRSAMGGGAFRAGAADGAFRADFRGNQDRKIEKANRWA